MSYFKAKMHHHSISAMARDPDGGNLQRSTDP